MKSLAAAEELEMPYEQARVLYQLGTHPAPGPAGPNADHLRRAAEIFARLGAVDDHAQATCTFPTVTASSGRVPTNS